jgi:hypothetical protein
MTAAPNRA